MTASAAAAVAAAYAAFASSESHFVGSPIFVSSALLVRDRSICMMITIFDLAAAALTMYS